MATYGYIRVSTREQNEDRQCIALKSAGIPPENLFLDKQSGKDFNRPQYKNYCAESKKTTCSTSRASIVSGGIMRRFSSNGGF